MWKTQWQPGAAYVGDRYYAEDYQCLKALDAHGCAYVVRLLDTAVVTVQAIDMAVPSVIIKRDDGAVMTFKVEDKANLTGVKEGDKVQITYTRALAVSVESPKK